jgi:hypothetical protein
MRNTKKLLTLKILIIAALILVIATPVFSASQTVRVWVEYKGGQGAMVRNALKGAGAQLHYQFDNLNSFVITLPKDNLDSLARNPHVASIEVDAERSLIEPKRMTIQDLPDPNNLGQTIPYGIDTVQARDVWDSDRDGVIDAGAPAGEGRMTCIIDTGY